MKIVPLFLSALCALIGAQARADNFVTITPTGAAAATVVNRWVIGGNQSGLGYIDGNSGFPGATATNFFTITGSLIGATGNPTGFTSYLPTGAASSQGSVGDALTPTAYSGLTYVAENLSLIGPLSFYAIHHRTTGDYLALIQPGVPTVSDQKPMSGPGGPNIAGATGYFGLSYAADNAGGWGANLFYYLRRNALGETIFGSLIPALLSGPTDRWNLGAGRGFTDLAYTSTDVGFGFGPSQFYYLRLDPLTQTTFFGRLNPLTGVATDIQNLGGIYRTLVFTTTNVGYGANQFYSIGRVAQTITFAPFASRTACDAAFTFVFPVASSGLTATLAVTGPATVSGNTVTLTGAAGTVTLTASQAGDSSFAPAPTVAQSFVVTACAPPPPPPLTPQTITFAPIADRGLCDATFTLAPTASSGLPVALAVTSGPATISGNTVTLTGAGSVTVQALQAGNTTFASAPPVTQTFTAAKCAATITLTNLTNIFYGRDFNALEWIVATTSPAGLNVVLTHEGNLTVPAAVRSYEVVATIDDPRYAGTATATLVISADPRVAQTVSFGSPAITDHVFGDAPFTLNPTASSGLPAQISVVSGPATIAGNTVTLTGAGTVVLEVTQSGTILTHFFAALSQSFVVTKAPATIALGSLTQVFDGSPKAAGVVTTPAALPVNLTYNGSATAPSAAGVYSVVATINHANYQGGATGTLTIAPLVVVAAPVITNAPLSVAGTVSSPFSFAIAASGAPTVYTAGALPPGLSFNTSTGIISGTPSTVGTTSVLLGATSAAGTGNATLTITVIAAAPAPVVPDPTIPTIPGVPPIITNTIVAVAGTVATPFSYTITASGSPTSYGASGLPAGLTLNPSTGVISGTPTIAATSIVALTATSGDGTANFAITVTVAPATVAPIIASPSTAPATVGTPFITYLIAATGLPTSYTASGLPAGLALDPLTGAINGMPTTAGTFIVTLSAENSAGTSTATLTITVAPAAVAPIITSGASSSGAVDQPFPTYLIGATGLPTSYSATGLPDGLTLNVVTGAITGTPATAGTFIVTLVAANTTGAGSAALSIVVAPLYIAPSSRIVNFSARAISGVGDQALVVGFVVAGGEKNILVRGVGPGLAPYGVANVLADPILTLFGAGGSAVATNDDWQSNLAGAPNASLLAATAVQVGAFALPNGSKDAALLATLNSGAHTASLARPNSATGVALTEIYDTDVNASARLINVSARMNVTAGEGTLIAGLVIAGNAPKTVLIRGVGPTLSAFGVAGVLADPRLTVFAGSTELASNDNWETGTRTAAQMSVASAEVGAFTLVAGSRDAALLITLEPGSYTVHLTGAGTSTGVALIEVYDTQ